MRTLLIFLVCLPSLALAQQPKQQTQRGKDRASIVAKSRQGHPSQVTFPGVPTGATLSPDPGAIAVHARAVIDHSHGGHDTLHYWRLEVLEASGKTVWSQDYDRREFPVAAGATVTRDLHQRLQLPAGRYLVRASLLDVKWDMDDEGFPALVSTNADGSDHAIAGSYQVGVK